MPLRSTRKLCRVISGLTLFVEQQFRPQRDRFPWSLGNSSGLGIVAQRVRVYSFVETRA
jgi:hypothetical protein